MSTTSNTSSPSCCPECGCARVIDAGRGQTCTACGLVVEEAMSFVVNDPRGKEGVVSSHAVLHGNTTTLVGAAGERHAGNGVSLSRTQRRAVSYRDAKRSRVYHLVTGAAAAAQLPPIVVEHAVHEAEKAAALAPKGSSMAGTAMLAALGLSAACKRLSILRPRDDVLDTLAVLDVDWRLYARNQLRLGIRARRPRRDGGGAPAVAGALSALRQVMGDGDWLPAVSAVYKSLARGFVGMRAESATAVTAYLAAFLVSPAGVPLTLLGDVLKYRPASLYNGVKRVLRKIGIAVDGPLSGVDIPAILRARVEVGKGIVKETVVATAPVAAMVAGTATAPDAIEAPDVIDVPEVARSPDMPEPTLAPPVTIPSIPVIPSIPSITPGKHTAPSIPATRRLRRARVAPLPLAPSHVPLAPTVEFVAPRGNALRRARRRPVIESGTETWSWFPPCHVPLAGTLGAGPGPPLQVAAPVDGG